MRAGRSFGGARLPNCKLPVAESLVTSPCLVPLLSHQMRRAVAHDRPRLGAFNGLTTYNMPGPLVTSLQRFIRSEPCPTKRKSDGQPPSS